MGKAWFFKSQSGCIFQCTPNQKATEQTNTSQMSNGTKVHFIFTCGHGSGKTRVFW